MKTENLQVLIRYLVMFDKETEVFLLNETTEGKNTRT